MFPELHWEEDAVKKELINVRNKPKVSPVSTKAREFDLLEDGYMMSGTTFSYMIEYFFFTADNIFKRKDSLCTSNLLMVVEQRLLLDLSGEKLSELLAFSQKGNAGIKKL